MYYDYSGAVAQCREPRNHKKGKHIQRKYHLIREFVQNGEIVVVRIASANNLVDPFTKTLTKKVFTSHDESMGVRLGRSDL